VVNTNQVYAGRSSRSELGVQLPLAFLARTGVAVGTAAMRTLLPERFRRSLPDEQGIEERFERGMMDETHLDGAGLRIILVDVVAIDAVTTGASDVPEEDFDDAVSAGKIPPALDVVDVSLHGPSSVPQSLRR